MSKETLEKILVSSFAYESSLIIISGGEPTQHKDFFELMEMIVHWAPKDKEQRILILTNGLWAYNEEYTKMMIELAERPNTGIQVTHDPRFYPYNIREVEHKDIKYEHNIRLLANLGRTKQLSEEERKGVPFRNSPNCYNFRSVLTARPDYTPVSVMKYLETQGKFCTILFTPSGDISPSECGRWIIGNIDDNLSILDENARASIKPCDECGHYSTLPDFYKLF